MLMVKTVSMIVNEHPALHASVRFPLVNNRLSEGVTITPYGDEVWKLRINLRLQQGHEQILIWSLQ